MTTEILGLSEITEAQQSKYVTHNTALRQIEAKSVRVLSRTTNAQPGSPAAGDTYILTSGRTGAAWAAMSANQIAHYYSGAWHAYTPIEGYTLWVNDENLLYSYNGSAWVNAVTTDAELAALASVTSAADKLFYFTGSGTGAVTDFPAYGRTLVANASAADARTDLGLVIGTDVQAYDATLASIAALGTAADKIAYTTGIDTWAESAITAFGRSLIDDADASAARTTLGLVIGTNVQAYDAELAALAGLTSAADKMPYFTGSGTAGVADLSAFGRSIIDDADLATFWTTVGGTVNIDGGVIDGTPVGNSSAAAGTFTTLTNSGICTFGGSAVPTTDVMKVGAGTSGSSITTGTTQRGVRISPRFSSGATTNGVGFQSTIVYEAGSSTTFAKTSFFLNGSLTLNGGSDTATDVIVYEAMDPGAGTNRYGFYGSINASANKWNVYCTGTAKNYFNGSVMIGSATDNGYKLEVTGTTNITDVLSMGAQINLKSYAVAGLPSAATAGGLIYVSDETGGAVIAFSDGTNWRRVTDRSVVA